MLESKNIIVTGSSGFIGKETVNLLKGKHNVLGIDLNSSSQTICFDLSDSSKILELVPDFVSADVVIHLAGKVLNPVRKDPINSFFEDVTMTRNVLNLCKVAGVDRVILASSFYVYDSFSEVSSNFNVFSSHLTESKVFVDVLSMEWFGLIKAVMEKMTRESGIPYTIFRFGPVYGGEKSTSLVDDLIRSFLTTRKFEVWGEGKRKNQYVFVDDIAKGIRMVVENESGELLNASFNLISDEYLSIRDVVEIFSEKYPINVTFRSDKPEGTSFPYISPERIIDLGWEPVSLEDGIVLAVERHKKYAFLK